jgi:hypothetical protein
VLVDDVTLGKSQVLYNARVTSTSWIAPAALTSGHTYYWGIKAHSNNGDTSPWSTATTFGVG